MSTAAHVAFEATGRIRDGCLCLHVRRAERVLARRFDDALRALDLSNGQFSLLAALNRDEAARMSSVAELLGMDHSTLTAALKPLVRRGLVETSVDPRDRRVRLLALTRDGLGLLARAIPVWQAAHDALEQQLDTIDADGLRRDLLALARLPPG